MRTGTPISEGCPTRINGSAQSGLSCAIVLNSAGESVRHFIMASRLAAQLRFVTRAAPAMCASVRLRLFVDAEAHVQLSRPYWRQRVISSRLWDEIETYPPLPPVADAMRGSQGSAQLWLKRALSWLASREDVVLALDSDNYPCAGYEHIFQQLAARLDYVSAQPVVPFSGSGGHAVAFVPAAEMSTAELDEWSRFRERNLGFVLLRRHSPAVQELLQRFVAEYVRLLNCSVSRRALNADQAAWRSALFSVRGRVREGSDSRVCRMVHSLFTHQGFPRADGGCGRCLFMHHGAVDEYVPAFGLGLGDNSSSLHRIVNRSAVGRAACENVTWAMVGSGDRCLLQFLSDVSAVEAPSVPFVRGSAAPRQCAARSVSLDTSLTPACEAPREWRRNGTVPSTSAQTSTSCPRVLQLTLTGEHQLRLGWLDELPHSSELCAHLCLKGMSCGSEAVRRGIDGLRRMRVHSCVEEPGGHENGHEGVCAFRFLLDNYEAPWEHVFFLHGDVVTSHHAQQFKAFRAYLSRNEWPPWPRSRALMTAEHCGCGHWGGLLQPFGPRDFWFMGLTWWLGQMVEPREPTARALAAEWAAAADCRHGTCSRQGVGAYPLHNGTLSSPLGFMFAVDRAAALQRSRRFLEAQYRMCKVGVRVLPPGWTGAPTASRLAAQGFDYNPLVWGHVNERIPFFAFGHEFVERPVPDCLFEGDHATMNCTPPEASPAAHSGVHPHRRNASTGLPEVAPSVEWGCKPFDRGCGSVGR